jgi:hypothetical protein
MSNFNLKERLGTEPVRARMIDDCVALIEEQVKNKGGLSGIAIRTAYGTIKAIKKGFIVEVVDGMLDEWLEQLQPHYDTWSSGAKGPGNTQGNATFSDFLVARSDEVAESLLAVTDRRAENTKHKTAKKAYLKMRGSAKNNVVEAIPDLGRMFERRLESERASA